MKKLMLILVAFLALTFSGCEKLEPEPLIPDDLSIVASKTSVEQESSASFSLSSSVSDAEYSWSFEGGTPSTSTLSNPTIYYNSEGIFDVSLTIKVDGKVVKTLTKSNFINVAFTPRYLTVSKSKVIFWNKSSNLGCRYDGTLTDDLLIKGGTSAHYLDLNYLGNNLYAIKIWQTKWLFSIRSTESCYVDVNLWNSDIYPANSGALHRCWKIKEVKKGEYVIENAKSGCVLNAFSNGSVEITPYANATVDFWRLTQY